MKVQGDAVVTLFIHPGMDLSRWIKLPPSYHQTRSRTKWNSPHLTIITTFLHNTATPISLRSDTSRSSPWNSPFIPRFYSNCLVIMATNICCRSWRRLEVVAGLWTLVSTRHWGLRITQVAFLPDLTRHLETWPTTSVMFQLVPMVTKGWLTLHSSKGSIWTTCPTHKAPLRHRKSFTLVPAFTTSTLSSSYIHFSWWCLT